MPVDPQIEALTERGCPLGLALFIESDVVRRENTELRLYAQQVALLQEQQLLEEHRARFYALLDKDM